MFLGDPSVYYKVYSYQMLLYVENSARAAAIAIISVTHLAAP